MHRSLKHFKLKDWHFRKPWGSHEEGAAIREGGTAGREPTRKSNTEICEMRACWKAGVMGEGQTTDTPEMKETALDV